jgi:DNA invertase Pin-like site-specific DNA recombinase
MLIGYARTATTEQAADLAAQEQVLRAFGVERVFTEPTSSLASRPVLKACLGFLCSSDTLVVTGPDRLACSVTDLLAIIIADLDIRGVGLVILSLGGQVFDMRRPDGKATLTILAGVAAWERAVRLERQCGRSKIQAKSRGKGRPRSINPENVRALVGTMSVTRAARRLNISRSSAYRMLQQTPRTP